MLEEVLNHIHNWFCVRDSVNGIHHGTYTVEDGEITLPFLRNGQYFRIVGSLFSDGLHRYGPDMECLMDETFTGEIWALAVPREVVKLAREMKEWESKNGVAASGPYQSESFGGYSYSKHTNGSGGAVTVWDTFRTRLKPYQKICGMW